MNKPALKESELMTQYRNGPVQIEEAIAGLLESNLDLALDDQSWWIRQIIDHIADGDDVWKHYIKIAFGVTDLIFDLWWYLTTPQIRWAEMRSFSDREIYPSLALFAANRNHIFQLRQVIEMP